MGFSHGLDVFVLAGQSNMAGRGGVRPGFGEHGEPQNKEWDGLVPQECQVPEGSVLRLNSELAWEEAQEPIHADIDAGKTCGIGPGLIFAAELLRLRAEVGDVSQRRIGLVPCAVGGTSIEEWVQGGGLYRRMIDHARAAMEQGGELRGVLWYQGESDCGKRALADAYRERLEALVCHVREDLEAPDLPFIQVGITAADIPLAQYKERVREAQRAVELRGVYYTDADGLELQSDGVHLTTAAQIELGKALARVYVRECGSL